MLKTTSRLQGNTVHVELEFCDDCAAIIRKALDGKSRPADLNLEVTAQIVSCSRCGCFDVMPDEDLERVGSMLTSMVARSRRSQALKKN